MRMEDLTYLMAIAEKKSLNKAAKDLQISHQSLGESMNNIEKELECKILSRSPQGVRFTEEGKEIVQFAQKTMEEYTKLLKKIAKISGKEAVPKELNIYASARVNEAILYQYIEKFYFLYPEIQINVFESAGKNTISKVTSDLLKDISVIGFITIRLNEKKKIMKILENAGEHFYSLAQSELIFLVGKDHPLSKKKEEKIENILKYPLIHFGHDAEVATTFFQDFGNYIPTFVTASHNVWCNILKKNKMVGYVYDYFLTEENSLNKNLLEQFTVVKSKEKIIGDIGYILPENPDELEKRFDQIIREN